MRDQAEINKEYASTLISFFLSQRTRHVVEKSLIILAVIFFIIHLIIYVLNVYHVLPFYLSSGYFKHPLNTLYTPFSVILVAEVYLLIFYLPSSFTRSIGKQIEIVCLIEIRSVFKYVYETEQTSLWPWETPYFLHTTAALGLGLCLVLFYRLKPRREARMEETELKSFIHLKRIIASLLAIYLIGLAIYSFSHWFTDVITFFTNPTYQVADPNSIFYEDFFTALILVDVLLLLMSLWYIDDFGVTFRNCGFVISTIILRLSFTMEAWHAVAHAWFAGFIAVAMLLLQKGLKWRSRHLQK